MLALVPVWTYGAAISGVATSKGGLNSTDGHDDPIYEMSSFTQTLNSGTCTFEVRYAEVVVVDRRAGGSTMRQDFNSDYKISIDINAGSTESWRLYLSSHRKGDVNVRDDGGRKGEAEIGPVTTDHSVPSGSENYTVLNSLDIPFSHLASNDNDPQSDVNVPFDDGAPGAEVHGTGPAQLWFKFQWTAHATSIAILAGGDEAAVRLGASLNYVDIEAGKYPGTPSRSISADGHFVTGRLESDQPQLLVEASACSFPLPNGPCTYHTIGTVNCIGENFNVQLTYYDGNGNIICTSPVLVYQGVQNSTFEAWTTCPCPPSIVFPVNVVVVIYDTPGKSSTPAILASGTFQVVEPESGDVAMPCPAVSSPDHCNNFWIDTVRSLNGASLLVPVWSFTETAIGGFNLLIAYDPTALSFLGAGSGALLDSLEWEYFTYRTGAGGNCVGGCPNGLVRLVAIADLDNGPANHPTVAGGYGVLANLHFQVTSDRNFIGQCIPIRFYWANCGDNVISNVRGDTTYLDKTVSDASGSLLWDEYDDVQFPESARPQGLGAPDNCLLGGGPGKPVPERHSCFRNGWVCIDRPPDDRGDLNLNGIANEVGDAVLFTNYFVYGPSVWDPVWKDVQILSTDINNDGVVLTVADLIYLIRIITGDAQPFPPNAGGPKMSPYANSGTASYQTEVGTMRVSTNSSVDLGGALYVFRYSDLTVGTPTLSAAASSLRIKSEAKNGELRVLVYAWDKGTRLSAGSNEVFTVPVTGEGSIELVESQLSGASGMLLSTSMVKAGVPTDYALLQNYPNPFNAGTVIPFALKKSTHWSLVIYNILGQEVRSYEGEADAGVVKVAWDGTSGNGQAMSSGTYLYRITTPEWTASKKMTLIK
jgi:hypothetical protein